MNDEQRKSALDLMKRAGLSQATIDGCKNDGQIISVLSAIDDLCGEDAPDENWYRDLYLITGDHMQLTEEGWVPAEMNTKEYTGYEPMKVLDEVNAPVKERN